MRYHNITKDDMLNGDGLRVVLWVAGCSHHCKGCQNPQTWDPEGGIPYDTQAEEELFSLLERDYISGLTISGGDPLFEDNREEILRIVKKLKKTFPDKSVWIYTGYSYEDVKDLEVLELIDVLVDGRFILEERDITLPWKGSANQRVIDVKKTRELGQIVLHA